MVKDKDEPALSALDVGGYNYSPNRYDVDHAKYPDRVMVGTESFPQSSFEMWGASTPPPRGIVNAYAWLGCVAKPRAEKCA